MIKFRAWYHKHESMYSVASIDLALECITVLEDDYVFGFEEVALMQSAGLIDVNGVEIFEGDVVKVTDDDERIDFSDGGIGTICGLDELYMWYIDGQVHNGLFDISQQYYIEVIGNVHENPELMEVAE